MKTTDWSPYTSDTEVSPRVTWSVNPRRSRHGPGYHAQPAVQSFGAAHWIDMVMEGCDSLGELQVSWNMNLRDN
jgi:hypothetical protein